MRKDDITAFIKKDQLILYIAQLYLDRLLESEGDQHIRYRMRLLAGFAMECGQESLKGLLVPKKFDIMVDKTRAMRASSSKQKLGMFLKSACQDLKNIAIREYKEVLIKSCDHMIHLFSNEWKYRIGHKVTLELDHQTFNKIPLIPLSKDIFTLRKELDERVTKCLKDYNSGTQDTVYVKKTLACKAMLFNKRRGSEFTKIKRSEITNAMDLLAGSAAREMDQYLSPIEQKLANDMTLIKIQGKQGKGVPVLLHPEDWSLLKLLLADKDCQSDTYLFQNAGGKAYRGHDLLKELTSGLSLELPEAIR